MNFYQNKILPQMIDWVCGMKMAQKLRNKVVPQAKGVVLELGAGSGHNFQFYDPTQVKKIYALEPSREIWQLSEVNAKGLQISIEYLSYSAEDIPLDSESIDTVVVTFSLCTIPDVEKALSEAYRVLKPGGELVFCEHGLAPEKSVQKWQNRLNGPWRALAGGCNLNRPVIELVEGSGFELAQSEALYLKAPKVLGYTTFGVALKKS